MKAYHLLWHARPCCLLNGNHDPEGGRFGNRRVRAGSGRGKTEARCMTRSSICGYFWTATSLGWNLVVVQDTQPSVRRYRHHDIAISTTQCLLPPVCIHAANETGPPIATYHHSRRFFFFLNGGTTGDCEPNSSIQKWFVSWPTAECCQQHGCVMQPIVINKVSHALFVGWALFFT